MEPAGIWAESNLAEPTGVELAVACEQASFASAYPKRPRASTGQATAWQSTHSPLQNSACPVAHRLAARRPGGVAAPDCQELSYLVRGRAPGAERCSQGA